jgi:general secretion pathway protein A
MYNSHFGFAESPFENNLDQRFLFLTEDHKEVLAALLYFIKENKAFAILCGDVGTGKTMLLNSFIDRVPASYHPIVISNPSVEFREILDYVARTLGLEVTGMNVLGVIDEVKQALLAAQAEKKFYFLVIDEAHLLSDRSLDDIRLLSNIESPDRKLLQILLVGQYELSYKLQRPQMRQLRQRITINRFLSSMDFDETSRYINHRLKMVGSTFKKCFESDCLPLIYKITDGVPRQINHLCDNALLVCKADDRKKVNKKIVRKTDKALRSDLIFAPRSPKHKRKSGWLQTRVRPLTAAAVCVAVCLAVLFFAYRAYFSKIGRHTVAQLYQKTAPSPQRSADEQKKQNIAGREKAPIAQSAGTHQSPGETLAISPEARHSGEEDAGTKPSDSFTQLSTTLGTYPDVTEVMSSDLEASDQKEDQPQGIGIPETTAYHHTLSTEAPEKGGVSATPDKEPEIVDKNGLLSEPIAKKAAPVPDTEPRKRDSGEDKQPVLSSETPILTASAAISEVVSPYAPHDLSRLSSEKVVVKEGDTLSAIAHRHYRKNSRAAVAAILSANPSITDENRIYSGQVLVLPEAESDYRPVREPMEEKAMEFSIQVCTLLQSSRAVAEDYASKLKQRGYPVYITELHGKDGGRMYKICIGKYQNEAEAMDAALYFQEKEGKPYVIIKSEVVDAALYFQEKEGKPYVIIKSEVDSAAPPNHTRPFSDLSESEGSATFTTNDEDRSRPLEDAPQKNVLPDSAEQGVQ